MKKINLFAILILLLISSCTDKDGARKTLERSGYTSIEINGHGWFCGSDDDSFSTKFTAVAVNGDTVTGCVTGGWFKGNTIRVDD
jgi:hypothetical protein